MADTYASIAEKCAISESQEELLNSCRLYNESKHGQAFLSSEDSSSASEDLPVESTGIVICSMPSSSSEADTMQEDQFQTPEEQLLLSSEELRADPNQHVGSKVGGVDMEIDRVDSANDTPASLSGTVDLGRDTDLVISDVFSSQKGVSFDDDDVSGKSDLSKSKSKENEISAGNDPMQENLRFSEGEEGRLADACEDTTKDVAKHSRNVLVGGINALVEDKVDEPGESSIEEKQGLLKSVNDLPSDFARESPPNLPSVVVPGENVAVGGGNDSTQNPPVISVAKCLESKPMDNSEAPESGKKTSNVNSELKAAGDPVARGSSKGLQELRRLPDWNDGVTENATGGSAWGQRRIGGAQDSGKGDWMNSVEEDGITMNKGESALEALKTENMPQTFAHHLDEIFKSFVDMNQNNSVKGSAKNAGNAGDDDILEVARRAGMKIPRPRWWRRGVGDK